MNDLFEDYIRRHKGEEDCVALVCASYKPVYQRKHRRPLPDSATNADLATYGDALLRFSLMSIFLGKVKELSEHAKHFLTDEFLIERVARHYDLLAYMLYDRKNPSIPKDYVFYENDRTKYIATTVEAVLGGIYMEQHDMDAVIALVESWTHF